jgi:transketolase
MGELFGEAVEGELFYVPREEFERVLAWRGDKFRRAAIVADLCRVNALYMIARAGSGHIGSSFSAMDIVAWLHLEEMRLADPGDRDAEGDRYFSSKGHDAPGLYAVLTALGRLDFELLHKLRRIGGLPGHPDISTPGIVTNTGSLGMGVSKAKGLVRANRLRSRQERIFVLTGDGELQEGQFWESLLSAANHRLREITVIIDHNKLQSDTFVRDVSDLGDLAAKLRAFGWHCERCDGHDIAALSAALARCCEIEDRPQAIIADTIKGRGVSVMEHTSMQIGEAYYRFHSGAPAYEAYRAGTRELVARVNQGLASAGLGDVRLMSSQVEKRTPAGAPQRMVQAYSAALLEQAGRNDRIVALDADLVLDTGLIPFKERYPERFVECGIAEQDMVSQAGGIALRGLQPVVHSFACFLTPRANEQIYNNATERTKIVYVGSLAGVVPGGPGHSHQAVRDISVLASVPGLVLVEGADEAETARALDWCLNVHTGSSYLRLVSIPCSVLYKTSPDALALGRGRRLLDEGGDVAIIGYGPVLLPQAWLAAEALRRDGISVRLLDLPWLNRVDGSWLRHEIEDVGAVLTLDNHYVVGGQGEMIAAAVAGLGVRAPRVRMLGVTDVPVCGTNDEVLAAHGLDAASIARAARDLIG